VPLDNVGGVNPGNFGVSLLQSVVYDELANQERIKRAWLAYQGEFTESLKVTRTPSTGFLIDDNVPINFVKVIVNVGHAYLFGKGVEFQAGRDVTVQSTRAVAEPASESTGQMTPEEVYLTAVWKRNRKALALQNLAINGGICGTVFVKIVPQPAPNPPRLIVLDPQNVSMRWAPDDIDHITGYAIQYMLEDPETNRLKLYRQLIEETETGTQWIIQNQISREESNPSFAANFSQVWPAVVWEDLGPPVVWPFPFAPIVHAQNLPMPNVVWGEADITIDVMKLNDTANAIMSNINRIIRLHAHPKTWVAGMSKHQMMRLDIAPDNIITLPNPDAKLQNLEMTSDLQAAQDAYKLIRKAIHETTQIPEIATTFVQSITNLSAVAMHILYGPLLEKTRTKRETYGYLLCELNRRLLAIARIGTGYETPCDLRWPELLPATPLVERQVFQIDSQFGVSNETVLEKLGYTPVVEESRMAAQQKQELDQQMSLAKAQVSAGLVVPGQTGSSQVGPPKNSGNSTVTATRTTGGPRSLS